MDSEGMITGDWSRCVRNITVSSRDHAVKFEAPAGTWQSCGSQGKVSKAFFLVAMFCIHICIIICL